MSGDHAKRALLLSDLGKDELAESKFRAAIAADVQNGFLRARLAHTLTRLQRFDEALDVANEACSLAPANPEAHWARSHVLFDLRNMVEAERAIREAVRLAPEEPVYLAMLAIILINLRQYPEALTFAEASLARSPALTDGLRARAIALRRLERLDEAEAAAQHALALHPNDSDFFRIRGHTLLALGQASDALSHFFEARRLAPTNNWDASAVLAAMVQSTSLYRATDSISRWWKRQRPMQAFFVGMGLVLIILALFVIGDDNPLAAGAGVALIYGCVSLYLICHFAGALITPFVQVRWWRDLGVSRFDLVFKHSWLCVAAVGRLLFMICIYSTILIIPFVLGAIFLRAWLVKAGLFSPA